MKVTTPESFQVTGLQTHTDQRKRHWKDRVTTKSDLEFREGRVDFIWPKWGDSPRRKAVVAGP